MDSINIYQKSSVFIDFSLLEKGDVEMGYVKGLRKLVGNRPLILPGSVVIIINERDEVLLQLRGDGGWGLPGGIMELGESFEETARREVFEETGLTMGELKLNGVYSGEEFYLKVANGDELYSVTAVFVTSVASGEMVKDGVETLDIQYFPLNLLPENLSVNYRKFIESYKQGLAI